MSTLKLAALLLALGAVAAAPREFNFVKGECAGDTVYDDYFPFKSINSEDPADTYGAEAAPLLGSDYDLLWTVEYFEGHKVLTNTHSDTTYVLYQCGLDQPVVAGADKYVAVPVTRAAATTTMLLPWFEMLGEREAIVAYTGAGSEVTSACINKMIEDGTCAENAVRRDSCLCAQRLTSHPPSLPPALPAGLCSHAGPQRGGDVRRRMEPGRVLH